MSSRNLSRKGSRPPNHRTTSFTTEPHSQLSTMAMRQRYAFRRYPLIEFRRCSSAEFCRRSSARKASRLVVGSQRSAPAAVNESYFCLVQAQSFAQLQTPLLSHSQPFLPHALQVMVSSGAAIEFQTRKVAMGFCGDPDLSRALRRPRGAGVAGADRGLVLMAVTVLRLWWLTFQSKNYILENNHWNHNMRFQQWLSR